MPLIPTDPPRFWRLPWAFDVPAMQADLDALVPDEWQVHFNTDYHDGGWSGLALVSSDGNATRLHAEPGQAGVGQPTPLHARCPALAAALARFPFMIESARLLRLGPGAHIREHRDHGIGLEAGSVRLHVPIRTAPGVEFYVDGVRLPMGAGECWYVDFGLPHRVQNRGTQERVHLVVDCRVDAGLLALLPTRQASEQQLQALSADMPSSSQQRFEQFRAAVLRRPALQDLLLQIDDSQAMAARVVQLGADFGLGFTTEDVHAAAQSGWRQWMVRHTFSAGVAADAPAEHTAPPPPAPAPATDPDLVAPGWVPVLAQPQGQSLSVSLCRLDARRFTEPFFEDSITACMRAPFHSLFRQHRAVEALDFGLQRQPGLAPSGFIFHMSRCGSTLLSQALAASPAHRVLSEPGPVDAALHAGPRPADDPERGRWLQVMLGMFGHRADPQVQRLYVKFDSWHARHLALIRRCYPRVPWLFVVRDPVEVIVSHLRRPGAQMVPGMVGFIPPGVDLASAIAMPRAQYAARMLGAICQSAVAEIERDPGLGLLVDYADLVSAIPLTLLPHLGVPADAAEPERVAQVLRLDAKNPWFEFSPDSSAKQGEATPAVHAAAEQWAMPSYRRLKQLATRTAS